MELTKNNEIDWGNIPDRVFKIEEFDDPHYPGSGVFISPYLFQKLLSLRLKTGWPIIPHGKVGGAVDVKGEWGHAKHSYHLKERGCRACDFHFSTTASTREQFHAVASMGFTGIGVYYDWKWNGKPLPIGFHVDARPASKTQIWKRINKKYIYFLK